MKQGEYMGITGTPGGKIEPGLNAFADCPAKAAEHLRPLLLEASGLVPSERHANTKVSGMKKRTRCVQHLQSKIVFTFSLANVWYSAVSVGS